MRNNEEELGFISPVTYSCLDEEHALGVAIRRDRARIMVASFSSESRYLDFGDEKMSLTSLDVEGAEELISMLQRAADDLRESEVK